MIVYRFVRGAVKIYAKVCFGLKIIGKENEPKDKNYIAVANHSYFADPIYVASALKGSLHFVAKSELTRGRFFKSLAKLCEVIPIHRGESDITALKNMLSVLKKGENVAIFPQGTRIVGEAPNPKQAQKGVGLIAARTKTAVLPVTVCYKGEKPRHFSRVTVKIGKPIEYEEYSAAGDFGEISEYLFKKVTDTFAEFKNDGN